MAKYAGYVAGMMVLSICLSVLFVFLTKAFPKCVVYSMIVLTFVVYLVLIIIGFVMENIALSVVFIIVLLINAIILWCYWGYIKIGIVLIECAGGESQIFTTAQALGNSTIDVFGASATKITAGSLKPRPVRSGLWPPWPGALNSKTELAIRDCFSACPSSA